MTIEMNTPTRVFLGPGSTKQLSNALRGMGQRCLLVTGSTSAAQSGALAAVQEQLNKLRINTTVYNSVQAEPTVDDVERGVELVRGGTDLIVAVGGGSAIDTAKAVSASLALGPAPALVGRTLDDDVALTPVVAVPTTAGSGAEVTKGAIITDSSRNLKSGIRGNSLIPRVAVVDPAWLPSMPQAVAAQTSFDALAHAIEGFVARRADSISRMWCRESLQILRQTLPAIGDGSATPATWAEQARASLLGGFAVAHASTGYPHRIQQALGGNPSVTSAHGRGLAAVYPAWVDELYRRLPHEPMDEVASLLGGIDLRKVVRDLISRLGLPASLPEMGYTAEHVEIAQNTLGGNLENDPLSQTEHASLETVLMSALSTGGQP